MLDFPSSNLTKRRTAWVPLQHQIVRGFHQQHSPRLPRFLRNTPLNPVLEFCKDDEITRVSRVFAHSNVPSRSTKGSPKRRLQSTTSEAGQAHQVNSLLT